MKAKEIQRNILLQLYEDGELKIEKRDKNKKEMAIAKQLEKDGILEIDMDMDFLTTFHLTGKGYIFVEENYWDDKNITDNKSNELDSLYESYNLLTEQLSKLRRDKIIETDTLVKFKLEEQIKQKEQERIEIEKQIKTLEEDGVVPSEPEKTGKYEIHIHGKTQGLTIGDKNRIESNFNEREEK